MCTHIDRTHAEQAHASNAMYRAEAARRQEEGKRAALELSARQEQHEALVRQQQGLLESLAQRDREVGGLAGGGQRPHDTPGMAGTCRKGRGIRADTGRGGGKQVKYQWASPPL